MHLKELRTSCIIMKSDNACEKLILIPNINQGTFVFLLSSKDMLSQAITDPQPLCPGGHCSGESGESVGENVKLVLCHSQRIRIVMWSSATTSTGKSIPCN